MVWAAVAATEHGRWISDMSVGAIYIALGASVLAWRRWLIAQLRNVTRMISPERRQYIEALSHQSGPKRVFAVVRVCGIAAMVFGVASLLNI
jgi:hypothetical protein